MGQRDKSRNGRVLFGYAVVDVLEYVLSALLAARDVRLEKGVLEPL